MEERQQRKRRIAGLKGGGARGGSDGGNEGRSWFSAEGCALSEVAVWNHPGPCNS